MALGLSQVKLCQAGPSGLGIEACLGVCCRKSGISCLGAAYAKDRRIVVQGHVAVKAQIRDLKSGLSDSARSPG